MASTTVIQTKPRQRKGNKGGGKGATQPRNTHLSNQQQNPPPAATKKENPIVQASSQEEDANICFICAEPVKYFSISECNHRTCHVCALRLRALYKKFDCTFCKVWTTLRLESAFSFIVLRNRNPLLSLRFLLMQCSRLSPRNPSHTKIQSYRYSLRHKK
jgi:hypothetical protein